MGALTTDSLELTADFENLQKMEIAANGHLNSAPSRE